MANRLDFNDCFDNIQPKRFDAWVILVNEHSSRDRVCLGLCLSLRLIDWLNVATFRLNLDHFISVILTMDPSLVFDWILALISWLDLRSPYLYF